LCYKQDVHSRFSEDSDRSIEQGSPTFGPWTSCSYQRKYARSEVLIRKSKDGWPYYKNKLCAKHLLSWIN